MVLQNVQLHPNHVNAPLLSTLINDLSRHFLLLQNIYFLHPATGHLRKNRISKLSPSSKHKHPWFDDLDIDIDNNSDDDDETETREWQIVP